MARFGVSAQYRARPPWPNSRTGAWWRAAGESAPIVTAGGGNPA